jgi:hypothetical protein
LISALFFLIKGLFLGIKIGLLRRKTPETILLVCCFTVCLALTGGVAGKWAGTVRALRSIAVPLHYYFKVDGDKLTGTGESTQGVLPIIDGKITGNDFTFNLPNTGGLVKHTCKYYEVGDSIGMDIDFNGYRFHSTLKRSNK